MTIEDVTNPEDLETPKPKEVAPEPTDDDAPDNTDENPDDDGTEPEEEFEELEYGDSKYKVPKALAPIILKAEDLDRDYTQKTQSLADERRAYMAERESHQQEIQIKEAVLQDLSQLQSVEARLNQLAGLNWQAFRAENRQGADDAWFEYQQLKDTHGHLVQRLDGKKQELSEKMQRESAKQISQAMTDLSKPDTRYGWDGKFTTEIKSALNRFAREELGWSEDRIEQIKTARQVKELNLQRIGFEAMKTQRKALAPKKTEANPVSTLAGQKAKVNVDPDKMSNKEWNKWRQKQIELEKKRSA